MTRFQKIMAGIYAALYIAGLAIAYLDVYVWRAEEPQPSGAKLQAAAQAKAFYK